MRIFADRVYRKTSNRGHRLLLEHCQLATTELLLCFLCTGIYGVVHYFTDIKTQHNTSTLFERS